MASYSDDGMFCDNITIRRKFNKRRRCSSINLTFDGIDADKSIKIIETSSEPELVSRAAFNNSKSSYESDLAIDKMVRDYQLQYNTNKQDVSNILVQDKVDTEIENNKSQTFIVKQRFEKDNEITSTNLSDKCFISKTSNKLINNQINIHKSPAKCNLFEHIRSPVAMYIKQSPQVTLLQNVKPEKPLSAGTHSTSDFENFWVTKANADYKPLPSVAYKTAKITKMLEIPDEKKLPQCQWAKNLTSSLPKAVVIRHVQRKNITLTKTEDSFADNSFADLTLNQAKLSICTLETAYNKKK